MLDPRRASKALECQVEDLAARVFEDDFKDRIVRAVHLAELPNSLRGEAHIVPLEKALELIRRPVRVEVINGPPHIEEAYPHRVQVTGHDQRAALIIVLPAFTVAGRPSISMVTVSSSGLAGAPKSGSVVGFIYRSPQGSILARSAPERVSFHPLHIRSRRSSYRTSH